MKEIPLSGKYGVGINALVDMEEFIRTAIIEKDVS